MCVCVWVLVFMPYWDIFILTHLQYQDTWKNEEVCVFVCVRVCVEWLPRIPSNNLLMRQKLYQLSCCAAKSNTYEKMEPNGTKTKSMQSCSFQCSIVVIHVFCSFCVIGSFINNFQFSRKKKTPRPTPPH